MLKETDNGGRKAARRIGASLPVGYEIFDIKRGGMGIVYLVRHPELPIPLAVKTFHDEYLMDFRSVERFHQEARTWIRLGQHPHIVEAIFIKTIDNKPHIFMECIEGSTLKEAIDSGPMDLGEIFTVALQFCAGMNYAHTKLGIVHRDIKPANVMVTEERHVKITDFGLVKVGIDSITSGQNGRPEDDSHDASLTATGQGMGTPEYMAPEQWAGADTVDTRADIYSFGALLYELLSGKPPYQLDEGEPLFVLHARQLAEPPPDLDGFGRAVPVALKHLVLKCLEVEPDRRFASFAELEARLKRLHLSLFDAPWIPPENPFPRRISRVAELVMEGMSLASLEDHEAAIKACNKALAIEPKHKEALRFKGRSCRSLGNHSAAMQCFKQLEVLNPNDFEIEDEIAFCLNEMKQHEAALRHANLSIDLESNNFSSWNNKAIALFNLGLFEEAVAAFGKAIGLDPNNAEAWNNRGFLLGRLGKVEEPISCFRRAIELNPRYLQPYFNWGELLVMTAHVEEALSVIEKALAVDPNDPNAQGMKASLVQYLWQKGK